MEQELNFIEDESKLKITGCLDYKIYGNMSEESLRDFLQKDAERLACKFISNTWVEDVEIHSHYDVIDSYYNKQAAVEASMTYNHVGGCTNVSFRRK